MSAPVNVRHSIEQADTALGVAGLPSDDIFRRELREAGAAVVELIEADRQYDEARAAWPTSGTRAEYKAAQERCDAAVARRAAALAKVQPCKA